ncbi:hypothetical protein BCR43DRAFT_335685 [Syncephalastrum racemosum]|uniref:HIG1 domain-containing protein n=1 Tax=Syncephalastrum racemosum TaxID=13706 RepID=A0A1X2H8H9_SYNRA|nr:hypothetical protein BCR43DRAFT_335685 [Syncephalastrum racemosum]
MAPRKTLTEKQEKELDHIALVAGLKGAAVGASIGAVATYMTYKRSSSFRQLSRAMQSVMLASGGMTGYMFAVDRASSRYKNQELGYADETMVESLEHLRTFRKNPDETSTHRMLRYVNDNRWPLIGGSWAVSMVGALSYTFSNKYLTTQQKLVQARMYAQAATLVVLLMSASLSIYMGDDHDKQREVDEPDAQLRAVLNLPHEEKRRVQPASPPEKE